MTSTSTPLVDIATEISRNASIVTDFLNKQGHPQPGFSVNSPARFPPDALPEIAAARSQLIHNARQLQFLALGPFESLQWYALAGALDTSTLRWLYHYDVPATVPQDSAISFSNLARDLNLSERTLTRILRHAMTNNIFVESPPGHLSHTSLSLQLADPGNPIRGVVGHQTESVFPAIANMVEAHEQYGTEGASVTQAPFNVAFQTDQKALDWVAADPVRSARFAESMKGGASSGPFSAVHTTRAFDWQSLGDGVVVDVGGSAGLVSKAIATSAPLLEFIVQDQSSMIAKGQAELEPEHQKRITFQPHNFFDPNPVLAPACFLLRLILHDWPDSDAIAILRNLVPSMGPDTRILINDAVMPAPGTLHPLQEKRLRNLDMIMMSMFNGLERSKEDWVALIQAADPRLQVVGITQPEGSALSMIEIRLRQD